MTKNCNSKIIVEPSSALDTDDTTKASPVLNFLAVFVCPSPCQSRTSRCADPPGSYIQSKSVLLDSQKKRSAGASLLVQILPLAGARGTFKVSPSLSRATATVCVEPPELVFVVLCLVFHRNPVMVPGCVNCLTYCLSPRSEVGASVAR